MPTPVNPKTRQEIATMAMQGILANDSRRALSISHSRVTGEVREFADVVAINAVIYADALLRALDLPNPTI